MDSESKRELDAIAADRESSASTLLPRAIDLLRRTAGRPGLEEIAQQLCRAQPSMAGFRTACAIALNADDPSAALERLTWRLARAPAVIGRHAAGLLDLGRGTDQLRLVTYSRSRVVEAALLAVFARTPLVVCVPKGALHSRAEPLRCRWRGRGFRWNCTPTQGSAPRWKGHMRSFWGPMP